MSDEHQPILSYDISSAMAVSKNPYQGKYKKVLCVCSAGILRSPTAALVLSKDPFNFNTRCAGAEAYALVPVTEVLLNWADEIVCMSEYQKEKIGKISNKPIICLDIPDSFSYRDVELQDMIFLKYKELNVQQMCKHDRPLGDFCAQCLWEEDK